jgi:hypothetical protein
VFNFYLKVTGVRNRENTPTDIALTPTSLLGKIAFLQIQILLPVLNRIDNISF